MTSHSPTYACFRVRNRSELLLSLSLASQLRLGSSAVDTAHVDDDDDEDAEKESCKVVEHFLYHNFTVWLACIAT